jgi:LysM repeat protein
MNDDSSKKPPRGSLLYLGIISVFLFGLICFLSFYCLPNSQNLLRSPLAFDSQDSNEPSGSEEGFISQKTLVNEPPELCFVQKNTLQGFVPPLMVSPQVLGVWAEEVDPDKRIEIIEHLVEKGETLSEIAERYEITLETIYWANDLNKNSVIQPGQKLIILPVSGVMHIVKQGETLGEIAENYQGEAEEIITFNNLSEDGKIYIGDLLIIPNGKMPAPSPSYPASFPIISESSYFILPCEGIITQGPHFYNAIDIANDCGTPIYAAAGGTVQKIGFGSWPAGNFVRILHSNGIVTLYGHLSEIIVKTGNPVLPGQPIGYMGRTGCATGCHLHFDVLAKGVQNPLAKYPVGTYLKIK